jgi:hypothetical protein
MPSTDREQRTIQESTLYDIYRTKQTLDKGVEATKKYLVNWEKRAMSGMTSEEIDAVKQRASEADEV